MSFYMLGIGLTALGCFMTATGMMLMKHSAIVEKSKPFYRRGWWMAGVLMLTIIPVPLNFLVLSFVPLSLVAPLGGLTIMFSAMLAHCGPACIRERTSRTQALCLGLLLAGVGFVSAFGPKGSQAERGGQGTIDAVERCFSNWPFLVFCGLCFAVFAILAATRVLPSRYRLASASMRYSLLLAFAAAACGSFASLIVKVFSHALRDLVEGDAARLGPLATAVSLILLAVFAPGQLYLLNAVLVGSPVNLAVPLYQSLLITLQVISGGTFFGEFRGIGPEIVGFLAGTLLVIVGILSLFLEQRRKDARHRSKAFLTAPETRCAVSLRVSESISRQLSDPDSPENVQLTGTWSP